MLRLLRLLRQPPVAALAMTTFGVFAMLFWTSGRAAAATAVGIESDTTTFRLFPLPPSSSSAVPPRRRTQQQLPTGRDAGDNGGGGHDVRHDGNIRDVQYAHLSDDEDGQRAADGSRRPSSASPRRLHPRHSSKFDGGGGSVRLAKVTGKLERVLR